MENYAGDWIKPAGALIETERSDGSRRKQFIELNGEFENESAVYEYIKDNYANGGKINEAEIYY